MKTGALQVGKVVLLGKENLGGIGLSDHKSFQALCCHRLNLSKLYEGKAMLPWAQGYLLKARDLIEKIDSMS